MKNSTHDCRADRRVGFLIRALGTIFVALTPTGCANSEARAPSAGGSVYAVILQPDELAQLPRAITLERGTIDDTYLVHWFHPGSDGYWYWYAGENEPCGKTLYRFKPDLNVDRWQTVPGRMCDGEKVVQVTVKRRAAL